MSQLNSLTLNSFLSSSTFDMELKIMPPSLFYRLRLLLKHSLRIAFLPWPKYTFNDLAVAQDAIDGMRFQSMAQLLSQSKEGHLLLTQKPLLSITNIDWEYLSTLPQNTFGYAVWRHFTDNNILEEPDLGVSPLDWGPEAEYVKQRYRQTHDFRHVLLGLGISGKEEVLLNIYQASQFFLLLNALIGLFGLLKHGWHRPAHTCRSTIKAFREGKKSLFLMRLSYEDLWEKDLGQLRTELNLSPVGTLYPAVTSASQEQKAPIAPVNAHANA